MTGVYAIRNKLNGHAYIGSAFDIKGRMSKHEMSLRKSISRHPKLQQAWALYGKNCFEFIILEECAREECRVREQRWLDKGPQYNMSQVAHASGVSGWHHTPEAIQKITQSSIGRSASEYAKMRASETHRGAQ